MSAPKQLRSGNVYSLTYDSRQWKLREPDEGEVLGAVCPFWQLREVGPRSIVPDHDVYRKERSDCTARNACGESSPEGVCRSHFLNLMRRLCHARE
jgi:hypothetical protein